MELYLDRPDVLYNLAYECEGYLDQLLDVCRKIELEAAIIEFQQRFAIWTAYLGVFARKSQCLDTRLHDIPDLHGLVARLLHILRCSLQHCMTEMTSQKEIDLGPKSDNRRVPAISRTQKAALKTIDDTITRLDRLGTTIRQSSGSIIDTEIKEFAADRNIDSFTSLCANAIQNLYPDAHQALKEYLSKSMATRYARMLFSSSRNQNPRTRRGGLPTIEQMSNSKTMTDEYAKGPAKALIYPAVSDARGEYKAYSESVLSNVNSQQLMNQLRPLDEASTKVYKTSSIQVKQGNYPQLPDSGEGNSIITCQWCGESLNIQRLSERDWRQHIDRDLKPYTCLFEECLDGHSTYATFNEWCRHMEFHDWRWHQKIYLTPSWVCPLCTFSDNVYNSSQALYSHLTGSHDKQFTDMELQAISRQSKIEQPRAWNDCLLCCLSIEDQEDKKKSLVPKRPKEQQKQESAKPSRRNLEISNPGHHSSDLDSSETSSESDNADSHHQRRQKKDPSNTIARHIATHLQVLMLLTLRFAALQSDGEEINDDFKSNAVDVDEEYACSAISEDINLGRLSHLSSLVGAAMEDTDGEKDKEMAKDDAQSLSTTSLSFELTPMKFYEGEAPPMIGWPLQEDVNLNNESEFQNDFMALPDWFGTRYASPKSPSRANLDKAGLTSFQDDSAVKYGFDSKLEPEPASSRERRFTTHSVDSSSKQLFFEAIEKEDIATISALSREDLVETFPATDPLGFFDAIEKGDIATIRRLLKDGVNLEMLNEFGCTPLWLAVISAKRSVIQLLLDNGANVEAENFHGQTILGWALDKGKQDIVEMILAFGDAE